MQDEWLSASETKRLVDDAMNPFRAAIAITTRAHDGLMRNRAERYVVELGRGGRALSKETFDNVELPKEFWWAKGHEALKQNWVSGDFETWIDDKYYCRAYGVRFSRSDVEKLLPGTVLEELGPCKPADEKDEWVAGRRACEIVGAAMGQTPLDGLYTIIAYAKSGQVRGRALTLQQMLRKQEVTRENKTHNVTIPIRFWEECISWGHCALEWERGVFTVQRSDLATVHKLVLTGVQFDARGIDLVSSLVQPSPALTTTASDDPQKSKTGGRRMSERWRDWVAELAFHIHENGYPEGSGSQGQQELIDAIADRLAKRGAEPPARATVQGTVQAVLARYRSAGK